MRNILNSITEIFRPGDDQPGNNEPQVSPNSSRAERDMFIRSNAQPADSSNNLVVTDTVRSTQPESVDDCDAHFVLGYN